MVERQQIKTPKGSRDMLPNQMAVKEKVFDVIRNVYKQHGAVEIDTPVFERKDILLGKYGEQQKLIFDLQDQGGELLSLRYDLTVPFARYMAQHNLQKIKRFHFGKVYRRDQPSIKTGRFREFYQCDYDIAGPSDPMVADAEVLRAFSTILMRLDIDFVVKLNDRRFLDAAILIKAGCAQEKFNTICSSIDKLDKEPWESVQEELIQKGLGESQTKEIKEFVELQSPDSFETLDKLEKYFDGIGPALQVLKEQRLLIKYLTATGVNHKFKIDTSLARGLDYYTGMIFEAVLQGKDAEIGIGSIAGGGRYDNLIGMFSQNQIPSVGGSIGVERIFTILEDRANKTSEALNPIQVFVGKIGSVPHEPLFQVSSWLWKRSITTVLQNQEMNFKEMLKYCLERNARYLLCVGENEFSRGAIVVKDLLNKEQVEVPLDEEKIMALLKFS